MTIIKVSPTSAFEVKKFKLSEDGEEKIRISLMWRSKAEVKNKNAWKHGKGGVSIPLESLKAVRIALRNVEEDEAELVEYSKGGRGKKKAKEEDE